MRSVTLLVVVLVVLALPAGALATGGDAEMEDAP